jgi:hypothetical protein
VEKKALMARCGTAPAATPPPASTRAPASASVTASTEQAPTAWVPAQGLVNFFVYLTVDWSELTQGGTIGFDFNLVRGAAATFGLSVGAGALGCIVDSSACADGRVFLFFPLAAKLGIRLGSAAQWVLRVGAAPALIWRNGAEESTVKLLAGTGLLFNAGRGGFWLGIDFLPIDGVAHALSIGWLF